MKQVSKSSFVFRQTCSFGSCTAEGVNVQQFNCWTRLVKLPLTNYLTILSAVTNGGFLPRCFFNAKPQRRKGKAFESSWLGDFALRISFDISAIYTRAKYIFLRFGVAQCMLFSFLLISCAPVTQASATEVVTVYATTAAQPWLTELYTCAADSAIVLNVSAESPDIYLRIGEPEEIVFPVYQIDEEEILIVAQRESLIQKLSLEEGQALFAQGNSSGLVQVWVYSSDADLQRVFDQLVMKGRSVTSSARVAFSPQNMSDVLNSESTAVGILPRHWMTKNMREVFSVGFVPVLVITKQEPQGAVVDLVSCLQRN